LTVEARHASYVRAALGESPFPKPYDTPLDFMQVYSLAAQFITGFAPGSAALPFMAFPPLSVQASRYPYTEDRSSVTFNNAFANALAMGKVTKDTKVYAVFYSGLDTYYVPVYVSQGNKDVSVIAPVTPLLYVRKRIVVDQEFHITSTRSTKSRAPWPPDWLPRVKSMLCSAPLMVRVRIWRRTRTLSLALAFLRF
jgi:hypothetical protein